MHPLSGSWIANIDKSRRDPHHQFSQATMRFEVDAEQVVLTYGGINASGRQEHGSQALLADGQEHPVPQAAGTVATTTLDPQSLQVVASQNGQIVGRSVYAVSHDGLIMTATVSGVDASGRPFEQVIVFDRE